MCQLRNAIKALHARKDRAYGAAWKRRGERISIVPNIARKVDRLTAFVDQGVELQDESIVDTAIDLSVYCFKYLLFLAEQHGTLIDRLKLARPSSPLSDQEENFNQLVEGAGYDRSEGATIEQLIGEIAQLFEGLWPMVENGASLDLRFSSAQALCSASVRLVARIRLERADTLARFVQGELSAAKRNSS